MILSCKDKAKSRTNTDEKHVISFYMTDTTVSKYPFVKLTLIKGDDYLIDWGTKDTVWHADLDSLTEGEGYRMPPTIIWMNKEFICLMTNYTLSYSQHLFLPLKSDLHIRFFKEDVEYSDSTSDRVAYIVDVDSVAHWCVENLKTGNKKLFDVPYDSTDVGYPWYHDLDMTQDEFTVVNRAGNLKTRINIKNL